MTDQQYLAQARAFAAEATGREPHDGEVAMAAACMCAELARQISAGFLRWPPTRPVRPPKPAPQRID